MEAAVSSGVVVESRTLSVLLPASLDLLGPLELPDSLGPLDPLMLVDSRGPLGPLELPDSLGPLELLDSLDPLELPDSLDPLELLDSLDPLELLDSLDPLELLDSLGPLELLDPLSVPVAEIGVSPPSISQLNLPDVTSDCIAFNSFNTFSVFTGIFLHATSWILMCLSINGNSSANVVPGSAKLARNSAACFSNAFSFSSRAKINAFNPMR